METKLGAMEALDAREQQLIDELDTEALDAKLKWLAKELDGMVTAGQLNKEEKAMVLEQLHTKLEAVELQIATADSEAKEKRAAKLREGHAELVARIDTVSGLKPAHRAAKFEKEMVAARKQLLELDKLEVLQLLTMAHPLWPYLFHLLPLLLSRCARRRRSCRSRRSSVSTSGPR